ncbi:MAG: hypothetical protein KGL42_11405 [Betaproteobacteria bacterium]|jgi:hypothetical protein|nr:hypothetical protein [Betaproteobacteria bacterium]
MGNTVLDALVAVLLTTHTWLMWQLTREHWGLDRAQPEWRAIDPFQDG